MKILALTSAYPEPDDGNVVVTPTVKYFCEKWAQSGNQVIVIHNNSCFSILSAHLLHKSYLHLLYYFFLLILLQLY